MADSLLFCASLQQKISVHMNQLYEIELYWKLMLKL